ncbi:hypothetical protein UlMin_012298 [Ulmus minor]
MQQSKIVDDIPDKRARGSTQQSSLARFHRRNAEFSTHHALYKGQLIITKNSYLSISSGRACHQAHAAPTRDPPSQKGIYPSSHAAQPGTTQSTLSWGDGTRISTLGGILYSFIPTSLQVADDISLQSGSPSRPTAWVQRDSPFQGPAPSSTSNSPSGSDSTSAVAHLMEGLTTKMDRLRVIHPTGQPNPQISPLYGTLSPTGPSHPMSRSTRGLGYPTEWVAPWVRSVPMESLDTPRSVHVASHEGLQGIDHATWSLMFPLWPLIPGNPTEERQKRMTAADDSSEEEEEDAEKPYSERPRAIFGDDLRDSFVLDEEEPRSKKGWIDDILEKRDAENSESEGGDSSEDSEENDEGEEQLLMNDWEHSDDDNLDTDLDEEGEEHDEHGDADEKELEPSDSKKAKSERHNDSLDVKKKKIDAKQPSFQLDLPYLIEAPNCFEELFVLLENCSINDIILVINHIRVSNAIKLAAKNWKKMQVFYGVLLQYLAVIANEKPLNIELLDLLVKPLMEMSVEIPYFAAICARQRILRTQTYNWPSSKTLFLLRLWSLIFPWSDFHHAVMTPAILLMCEYLMRCPVVSGHDIVVGSFLCSMLLYKFCLEAIVFLQTLLMATKDGKPMSIEDTQYNQLMELKALKPLLIIREHVNEIEPLNFFTLTDLPEDSSFSTQTSLGYVTKSTEDTIRGEMLTLRKGLWYVFNNTFAVLQKAYFLVMTIGSSSNTTSLYNVFLKWIKPTHSSTSNHTRSVLHYSKYFSKTQEHSKQNSTEERECDYIENCFHLASTSNGHK